MKIIFILVGVLFIQGCEIFPSPKFVVGDYVSTNLDKQIGRVDGYSCHHVAFTEYPCNYKVTFPLINGGYSTVWIEGVNLDLSTSPLTNSNKE